MRRPLSGGERFNLDNEGRVDSVLLRAARAGDLVELHCVAAWAWLHAAEDADESASLGPDCCHVCETAFGAACELVAAQCRLHAEQHRSQAAQVADRFDTPLRTAARNLLPRNLFQREGRLSRAAEQFAYRTESIIELGALGEALEAAATRRHIGPDDVIGIVGVWDYATDLWRTFAEIFDMTRERPGNESVVALEALATVAADCRRHVEQTTRLTMRAATAASGMARPRRHRPHRSSVGAERLPADIAHRWADPVR